MKARFPIAILAVLLVTTWTGQQPAASATRLPALQAPALKWQHAGCYSSWCETGWYSAPAVADLDGDGSMEVIGAAYTLFILDGETGAVKRSVAPPVSGARTWPGVVVADLDDDEDLEIVTAHGSGYVRVLDHAGDLVWTRRPATGELRGLSVYDLDGDDTLEIVVTAAVGDKTNTWVYEHTGAVRPGWPQLVGDSGYAYGVFNDNAAVADLDGDDVGEIVVPSDVHYICAYEPNGVQIPAHSMYGGKAWGRVGIWESLATELKGWGDCSTTRAERYRTNFAHGPATIADVDGDGTDEVVAVGNVYDCAVGHPPGKYIGVYVLNADRSRFQGSGFDWRTPPVDTGAPLSEDWNTIENAQPNPAVADLDGDGEKEIVFASYDGRVHAFWLDKTEHGSWPYAVYTGGAYRFASEPAIADLDADGHAEVVFASWVRKGTYQTGKLHVLDYLGNPLYEVNLPAAYGSPDWNGALAAPTLANIDADAELEVVLNTAHSGFVAYDLPGTNVGTARVLWGTGRGNYQRTGSLLAPAQGTLQDSTKRVWPVQAGPGDTLGYTIRLENPGPALENVRVTDTLPAQVTYLGDLWASAGATSEVGGVITWTGTVQSGVPVTITYGVTVSQQLTTPLALVNAVAIDDGLGNVWQRQAVAIVNGHAFYLPLVFK